VRASCNGLTVLVVEDDWLVRADIVLGLQQEGWVALEASTGDGALKLLLRNAVDLLITDIGLADAMTGWDVAEALRTSHPMAPVIYASGGPNNDARQVPESVFLSKPVVISRLLAACRSLVNLVRARSRSDSQSCAGPRRTSLRPPRRSSPTRRRYRRNSPTR
jgi:two-component system, response regulator PdtaR